MTLPSAGPAAFPIDTRGPVPPAGFYGRQALVEEMIGHLVNGKDGFGVYGESKIGKTSLLNYLWDPRGAAHDLYHGQTGFDVRDWWWLPVRMRGLSLADPAHFWKLVLDSMQFTRGADVRLPAQFDALFRAAQTGPSAEYALFDLVRSLLARAAGRVVLMFDDFDDAVVHALFGVPATPNDVIAGTAANWEAVCQRLRVLVEYSNVHLIVFSTHALPAFSLHLANRSSNRLDHFSELVGVLSHRPLGGLSQADVAALISDAGDEWLVADWRTPRAMDVLWSVAGGHPFLVRVALGIAHSRGRAMAAVELREALDADPGVRFWREQQVDRLLTRSFDLDGSADGAATRAALAALLSDRPVTADRSLERVYRELTDRGMVILAPTPHFASQVLGEAVGRALEGAPLDEAAGKLLFGAEAEVVTDTADDPSTPRNGSGGEPPLTRGGRPAPLTAREAMLYRYLADRVGIACDRADLIEAVWGPGASTTESGNLEQLVRRLRAKIEPPPGKPAQVLLSVHGTGYMLARRVD